MCPLNLPSPRRQPLRDIGALLVVEKRGDVDLGHRMALVGVLLLHLAPFGDIRAPPGGLDGDLAARGRQGDNPLEQQVLCR
ncbi:Uncharacterised protein [Mycobacteroides abscessus subsp. massiliense]|nr:Uncharacterised protein [Mycobacteroides abscessus subsp. massiliense]